MSELISKLSVSWRKAITGRWRRALPYTLLLAAGLLVFGLEHTFVWRALDVELRALEFDQSRALLLESWAAAILLGLLGGILTGRAWLTAGWATLFVAVTYAIPEAFQTAGQVPSIFGVQERLNPLAVARDAGVALAIAFLLAVPFSAAGQLLRNSFDPRRLRVGSNRRLGIALLVVLGGSAALSAGVDPVLRYGPDYGAYSAAPQPSASGSLVAANPGPSSVPVGSRPLAATGNGRVISVYYHSAAMGEGRLTYIYLPPGYSAPENSTARYPVLYLLHGSPGDPGDWLALGAPSIMDAAIHRRIVTPMIVVMADGDGASGHIAYQWNNAPNGANQIESAFLELVSYVDSHFRTIPDAAHRVIAGISSGGFGATNIAARHPSLFATVVSISGYFSLMGPVAGATPAYYGANSPAAILHTSPAARKLSYILIVGNNDPRFAQYSLTFAAELVQLGGRESLLFIPGGHSSHVWSLGLQLALKAVGRTPNLTA